MRRILLASTMAVSVAGLAIATTIAAMQSSRAREVSERCASRTTEVATIEGDHGFLGISYVYARGAAVVDEVVPSTPAHESGLLPGDRVLSIDGNPLGDANELHERIADASPGERTTLVIERDGVLRTVRPTLSRTTR